MEPKGILHLIDSLGTGGAQKRLLNDLKYLDGKFTHHVYTVFDDPGGPAPEFLKGGRLVKSLHLKKFSDLALGIARLCRTLKDHPEIDLIHTQLFCADIVGRTAARLLGKSVASTCQSAIYEPDSGLNSPWRRWIDQKTGRWVQKHIAVSAFVRHSLHGRLGVPLERIVVIPNSVDLEEVRPDPQRRAQLRKRFQIESGQFLWISVGRLNLPKGYRYLLEAMVKVRQLTPETHLFLVGDGPERSQLEEIHRQLHLEATVRFLGSQDEVVPLLDAADGFVFPSLSEGLPVALLEAMAMSKPCVASRIPPHEETLEDHRSGLLVPPRNASHLAQAMVAVVQNPRWALQMGEEALLTVREKFAAPQSAQLLAQTYEAILSKP